MYNFKILSVQQFSFMIKLQLPNLHQTVVRFAHFPASTSATGCSHARVTSVESSVSERQGQPIMIGLWSDPKQQPLKSKLLARVCGAWGPKIVCSSSCALVLCSEIAEVFCQWCIEIVSTMYLCSED